MGRIIHDGGSYRILHQEGTWRMRVRVDGPLIEHHPTSDLDAAIDTLHQRTLGKQVLALDLRNCPYATAPAIRSLLRWVTKIRQAPDAQRYRLVIMADTGHTWQRTSLVNLCRYAGEYVEITEEYDEESSVSE